LSAHDPPVLVDRPLPGVVRLRLNRPHKRNAVDRALVDALLDGIAAAGDADAVILASSTPDVFCAGADVSIAEDERAEVSDKLYALYEHMVATPAPIVAAIGGAAVGGGAQLAIASDLRVVGPQGRIRFAGPGHGLAVGAWALPSLVGRGRAMDLCLSMRWVDAEEAVRIGLAERRADDADAAALELATQVAGLEPAATRRVKAIVTRASAHAGLVAEEAAGNRGWSGSMARD
jgi:enoyl-CoA hydratase/carnithine racemase